MLFTGFRAKAFGFGVRPSEAIMVNNDSALRLFMRLILGGVKGGISHRGAMVGRAELIS